MGDKGIGQGGMGENNQKNVYGMKYYIEKVRWGSQRDNCVLWNIILLTKKGGTEKNVCAMKYYIIG